jgi:hypothetical protein
MRTATDDGARRRARVAMTVDTDRLGRAGGAAAEEYVVGDGHVR